MCVIWAHGVIWVIFQFKEHICVSVIAAHMEADEEDNDDDDDDSEENSDLDETRDVKHNNRLNRMDTSHDEFDQPNYNATLPPDITESEEAECGPNQVLIPAIRETRWYYEPQRKEWRKEVVIIKNPPLVDEFRVDVQNGNGDTAPKLMEMCYAMKRSKLNCECYFDESAYEQMRRSGVLSQKKRKHIGHTPQSSMKRPKSKALERPGTASSSTSFTINLKNIKIKKKQDRVREEDSKRKRHQEKEAARRKKQAQARESKKTTQLADKLKPSARRARGDPYIRLIAVLERALRAMRANGKAVYFEDPVDTSSYPNYPSVVKTPMCIKLLEQK